MEKRPLDHSDVAPPSKRSRQEDGPLPDEHMDAPQPSRKPSNDTSICDDCRSVDWSSIPSLVCNGSQTKFLDLRPMNATIAELANSTCRICAILSTIKNPCYDGKRCVLSALRLSDQSIYRMFWNSHHRRATQYASLGIMEGQKSKPNQYCFEQGLAIVRIEDLGASETRPSLIDYNKFRELMEVCGEKHKTCCAIESRTNILGLQVIDTKTQEVIKAPYDCQYVALSYVWGKDASVRSSSAHDIRTSPAVIRDAISVTNSMGYNYLWVDRYCISDSKEEEKSRMISQMDHIYANAAFTIVAAADGDTELGLCGVSMPRQARQAIIQDVALLELPLPAEHLTASKWATRGWTYQEGYLSRRRLIFTKSQVVYLCNGMFALESWQRLLSTTNFCSNTIDFHHLIPKFNTAKQRKFSAQDILLQIGEYSKRQLTRSSDSLNAILGVLHYYARTSANLTSPVLQLPWGLIANKHAKKDSFGLQFWWRHEEKQLPTRRPEFPSWSWTGWSGTLTFFEQEITLQPQEYVQESPLSYLNWELSMRDDDGNNLKMYDLARETYAARKSPRGLYRHQPRPKQLQVTCLVIPVSFQEHNFTEDQRRHGTSIFVQDTGEILSCDFDLPNGSCPIMQVWKGIYLGQDRKDMGLDQKVEEDDRILGLLFAARDGKSVYNHFHCLLARDTGGEFYERVGVLIIGDMTHLLSSTIYRRAYLDANGSLLDHFAISDTQRSHPFAETAERRTICLV